MNDLIYDESGFVIGSADPLIKDKTMHTARIIALTKPIISQYGNISTPTGTVTASAVTTTNDVTVGRNAIISTKPTLATHATNKKYVDVKAIALAIAMS